METWGITKAELDRLTVLTCVISSPATSHFQQYTIPPQSMPPKTVLTALWCLFSASYVPMRTIDNYFVVGATSCRGRSRPTLLTTLGGVSDANFVASPTSKLYGHSTSDNERPFHVFSLVPTLSTIISDCIYINVHVHQMSCICHD